MTELFRLTSNRSIAIEAICGQVRPRGCDATVGLESAFGSNRLGVTAVPAASPQRSGDGAGVDMLSRRALQTLRTSPRFPFFARSAVGEVSGRLPGTSSY